jgi:hypothetical protein
LYEYLSDGTSQYWFDIQTPTLSATASDLAVGAAQYANAAFAAANSSLSNDTSAGSYANSAFAVANNNSGINVTQNTNITTASSYANSAFLQANSVFTQSNTYVWTTANSAASYANAAFATANTITSASSYANSAFLVANNGVGIDTTQNTNITNTGTYANSAFSKANNALTAGANTSTSVQFGSLGVGTAASGTTGEIRATNDITAYYSDDRLKTKFGNIKNALKMVTSLNGFYYEANQTAQDLGYTVRKEVGLSAQEVQKVLPEIVVPAPIDEQYLTIHYEKMIPLLVEAIKELNKKIDKKPVTK